MNAFKSWIAPAFASAMVAGLLAACGASSPAPVLLMLPSDASTTVDTGAAPLPPQAGASAPLLAVRRVGIPEYLVARRVRYRADASTLAEWPNTYWAERIEIGVSREFVAAMRRQLPGWTLCDVSCADHLPTLTLQVDLVPMDYVRAAHKLQAHARVVLTGTSAGAAPLATREQDVEVATESDTPQAQAQAIAALVRQVAAVAAPMVASAKR